MNQRMLMFLNLFKEFKNYKDSPGTVFISAQASLKDMYKPYLHQGFEKYREVVEEAVKHYTVDTYARKLWLQNKKIKLKTLKEFLCLFFAFEQSSRSDKLPNIYDKQSEYGVNETHIHTPLDYRYDVFMATLLDRDMLLPENISIISWNYDYQLELAYMNYADCNIEESIKRLFIYPGIEDVSESKIIKLNGSAIQRGWKENNNWVTWPTENIHSSDFYSIILSNSLTEHKSIEYSKSKTLIDFAWEKYDYKNRSVLRAKEIIANTSKLIIIGYSFPNFNKSIDASLFSKFNASKCRISIQCPENDYESIEQNILSLGVNMAYAHIEKHKTLDQFYIPASQLI